MVIAYEYLVCMQMRYMELRRQQYCRDANHKYGIYAKSLRAGTAQVETRCVLRLCLDWRPTLNLPIETAC